MAKLNKRQYEEERLRKQKRLRGLQAAEGKVSRMKAAKNNRRMK